MRTIMISAAAAVLLFAYIQPASGQARFSGVVETGASLFIGEKSGEDIDAAAVLGFKSKGRFFMGLGVGVERRFLVNEQYSLVDASYPVHWDYTKPRILKGRDLQLFLDARYDLGEGRFKPSFDGRAGVSPGFSANMLQAVFFSVAAGCRYDLSKGTGVALRAFFRRKGGAMVDDVYDSMQGWFNSLGLRLSYEF